MRTILFAALLATLATGTVTAQTRERSSRDDREERSEKREGARHEPGKGQRETIEGNGNQVTRDVSVGSFSSLKASGIYELHLSQGSRESVKIEADENLHELFNIRNEGNSLVIDMKNLENKNLRTRNKLRVYVTFRDIESIELSTVGNVQSEEELSFKDLVLTNQSVGNVELEMSADKLDLRNTSVGNVRLKGRAGEARVRNSGVGSLEAGSFVVQAMNIENTGVGSAEVNAARELKVRDSMLGKVKNRGAAPVRKTNKVVI